LRILFLTWRDLANPLAGGAEVFTFEIARRLVSYGNEVTVFASEFKGCELQTHVQGIKTIRQGGKYSVYKKARGFLQRNISEFDVVVDEINTVPFRSQRVSKGKPVIALIHQLAREVWFYETRFPLNLLGYFVLEPFWLGEYKRVPTITVSESTRKDLQSLSFRRVHVIHNGISKRPLTEPPLKDETPVLIFVGRLVRSKLPNHAIAAFRLVKNTLPDAQLWILGNGYMRAKLEKESPSGVTFFGRVSDEEKFELLKRAHLLLAPSVREGWGISVIEANAMGTPAIGYAVPGLIDSIVNGVTGFLTPALDPVALSESAKVLLSNTSQAHELSMNALEWSKRFNWEDSGKQFQDVLQSSLR
jgi:glycosyltransferase involved in cell wall biosynthesis